MVENRKNDDIEQIRKDIHDIAIIVKVMMALFIFSAIAIIGLLSNGSIK